MKSWEANHPRAKVMERKRAVILDAAKRCFLETGYEGTSMEGIAKTAGVSIMTLYRHARSKDDVFSAVISSFCNLADLAQQEDIKTLLSKPFDVVLFEVGMFGQETLASSETAALLRIVVAEAVRFPHLAEMTFESLIGRLEHGVIYVLEQKSDSGVRLSEREQRELARRFVDRLVGMDLLRALLGLPSQSEGDRERRAQQATSEMLREIEEAVRGERAPEANGAL
jgi:TetR/AcrR family transcriptional repressor of mexJK operon